MLKRSKLLLAAAATMMVGTGSAGVAATFYQSVPAYLTLMYSDATKTEVVGRIVPECRWNPGTGPYVQYSQEGTYTYFQEDELVYYCGQYGPEPL